MVIAWVNQGGTRVFFNQLNSSDSRGYSSDLQVSDSAASDNATRPSLAVPPVVGTTEAYICCAW
ncbi:MAG: hypothetical protein ABIH45_00255 [Candidatus Omnitrophota bacterium]